MTGIASRAKVRVTNRAEGLKMKFKPCTNCGSLHKKAPFKKLGKFWCDHCGGKVEKS